jgi:23S rRNA (cytosine1962-C5)-methyltransferase
MPRPENMPPIHAFPTFRDAWILHRDDDLVAIDKPSGISSQAAEPEIADDVVTRLRDHLGLSYLGVHQRLDRDTSGVMVFALRREANGVLASAFESRTVDKHYVACVSGSPRARFTLRDRIAPGHDGSMTVVSNGGALAVTHGEVLQRRGPRALVSLRLETGRTHQARIQLSHAGFPIAGDALYGGVPAPRLLLHASSLSLPHPNGPIRFEAKLPLEFHAWLESGDLGVAIFDHLPLLASALERAVQRRWGLGRSPEGERRTTAFRLVNEAGDGLFGLAVDFYDGFLVAQLHGDQTSGTWGDPARRDRVFDALDALGFDGVYVKYRPKQANTLVDPKQAEIAPTAPVRGVAAPSELVVVEEGIPFGVRLADGLSTGLFLDQRSARRRVRAMAEGKAVLNLFAYTCGFTVAAALGGASRTVSVDVSAAALERGQANLARVGRLDNAHVMVADDVFRWLGQAHRKGLLFDVVVLDPPSYSTTKARRFVASSDYSELAAAALAVVGPGGKLLCSTNHRGVTPMSFRRALFDAGRRAGRTLVQVKDLPSQSDFPGEQHLKSALVTVGDR